MLDGTEVLVDVGPDDSDGRDCKLPILRSGLMMVVCNEDV